MTGQTRDQQIGHNLAIMRGSMSQQAVADAMRERGHKWSQSTVWSVEKGDRPLRYTESQDLMQVLAAGEQIPLEEDEQDAELRSLTTSGIGQRRALLDLLVSYFEARWQIADLVARRGSVPENLARTLIELLGGPGDPDWITEEALSLAGAGSPRHPGRGAEVDIYQHGYDQGKELEKRRRTTYNKVLADVYDPDSRYVRGEFRDDLRHYSPDELDELEPGLAALREAARDYAKARAAEQAAYEQDPGRRRKGRVRPRRAPDGIHPKAPE